MQAFTSLSAVVAPLDRVNVDTDAIIPKQFLKSIKRTGFGVNLFDEWRYLDVGEPEQDCSQRPLNTDFVLNQAIYQQAKILLTRKNFGCGSSREHAPWALLDFGFQVIIAPSFADIFYNNCLKNGILPIVLSEKAVDNLFLRVAQQHTYQLHVDLASQTLTDDDGLSLSFDINAFSKNCLLKGLDDIGLTLEKADLIHAYEQQRKTITPWLFSSL